MSFVNRPQEAGEESCDMTELLTSSSFTNENESLICSALIGEILLRPNRLSLSRRTRCWSMCGAGGRLGKYESIGVIDWCNGSGTKKLPEPKAADDLAKSIPKEDGTGGQLLGALSC